MPGGCIRWLVRTAPGRVQLVKIIAGIYQPDGGEILLDGSSIALHDAAGAHRRHGIAVIHQHPAVFPDLSVAENIFVGRQPRRAGRIDWSMMQVTATDPQRLRVDIDVRLPVKAFSIAERTAIEIVKALSLQARVLVMDEPTSTMSGREVVRLFEIVGYLKRHGVAIFFISHFIDEVLGIGDDVTILRSGRRVISCPAATLTPETTVRHMIGSDPGMLFPKESWQDWRTDPERKALLGRRVRQRRQLRSSCWRNPRPIRPSWRR